MNILSISVGDDVRFADKDSTNFYNILLGGKKLDTILDMYAYMYQRAKLMFKVNMDNGKQFSYMAYFNNMGNWPKLLNIVACEDAGRVLI